MISYILLISFFSDFIFILKNKITCILIYAMHITDKHCKKDKNLNHFSIKQIKIVPTL